MEEATRPDSESESPQAQQAVDPVSTPAEGKEGREQNGATLRNWSLRSDEVRWSLAELGHSGEESGVIRGMFPLWWLLYIMS